MLYGEYDNTGALIREYVYLNGQPLAQVDSGEVLSYLHTDHLGTPRYATNASGVQVWHWDSDAFGVGAPSGSATVNLRFAGQYWDDESGLHYNWNRYYDPTTGRYISSDPIGLAGGLNTYGYALANPIMYTDPEGLLVDCRAGDLSDVFGDRADERDKNGERVDPRSSIAAPGNCDPNDYNQRRNRQKEACHPSNLNSCRSRRGNPKDLSLNERLDRAENFDKCINARLDITECFFGGDKGHRDQIIDLNKASQNCKDDANRLP